MSKFYSDGMGTFIYIDKCEDDDNFINIKIEEEQENGSYTDINISLHKAEIEDLIKKLETLLGV